MSSGSWRWWHGWTRNLNAKVAALPMIFTTLVVFVGCSLWTVLYSFTKSKLLPKQIFDWPLNIQFPISFFDSSVGYFSWVGFAYEWDWKGFGAIIVSKNFVGLAQYERLLDASRNGRWAESSKTSSLMVCSRWSSPLPLASFSRL